MPNLKQLLAELAAVEGVSAVVVVSHDGFVIDGVANKNDIDHEAVGAVVSSCRSAAESLGRELKIGEATQSMVECPNGFVVISSLGGAGVLAVVADTKANLGSIRYHTKKRAGEIEASL